MSKPTCATCVWAKRLGWEPGPEPVVPEWPEYPRGLFKSKAREEYHKAARLRDELYDDHRAWKQNDNAWNRSRLCTRFPKHCQVTLTHSCGEHQPTDAAERQAPK